MLKLYAAKLRRNSTLACRMAPLLSSVAFHIIITQLASDMCNISHGWAGLMQYARLLHATCTDRNAEFQLVEWSYNNCLRSWKQQINVDGLPNDI